jgi:YD repeat-containing protein
MRRLGNLTKRHLFLLNIFVFAAFSIYGQEPTKDQLRKFGITSITTIDGDGHVKSIEVFNKEGDLAKILDLNEGDTILRKDFLFKDGLLQEEITYTTEGQAHRITKYKYDGGRALVRSESYNPDKPDGTLVYEYDQGKKVKETATSGTSGNKVTVFKYLDSRLSEQEITNSLTGKEERSTYKYDEKGRLTEKQTRYFFSNTTMTEKFVYDNKGLLTEWIERSSNGVSSRSRYEYDTNGILIAEIWKGSLSKTPSRTTYVIAYGMK